MSKAPTAKAKAVPSSPPTIHPRSSILNATIRLFGQQGYTGTSMRDIAKEVGVLPGSLYAHIDSKETLLLEIVDAGINGFLSAVEPIVDLPLPAEERLRRAIRAHVEVVAENPERSLVVFHQWRFLSDGNLAAAIEHRRRYERAFVRIFESGVEAGVFEKTLNKRIAVLTILGALNWTPEWYSADGPATASQLGDMMADSLLSGLFVRR
ncbi:MAG: TetR/AcrR family transcriptional regulator [Pseudomonadota bacterium]